MLCLQNLNSLQFGYTMINANNGQVIISVWIIETKILYWHCFKTWGNLVQSSLIIVH